MRLNLGCSDRLLQGYLNVDLVRPLPITAPFEEADLAQLWPWKDNSVEEIIADDIIEHLPNKIQTMNEIHRVLVPGGKVRIFVPTTDGRGAWQDPTHVSYWNRNSFFYYTICKMRAINYCTGKIGFSEDAFFKSRLFQFGIFKANSS